MWKPSIVKKLQGNKHNFQKQKPKIKIVIKRAKFLVVLFYKAFEDNNLLSMLRPAIDLNLVSLLSLDKAILWDFG